MYMCISRTNTQTHPIASEDQTYDLHITSTQIDAGTDRIGMNTDDPFEVSTQVDSTQDVQYFFDTVYSLGTEETK